MHLPQGMLRDAMCGTTRDRKSRQISLSLPARIHCFTRHRQQHGPPSRACTRLSNSGAPCNHPLYLSTLIAPLFTLFSISMTLWRLLRGQDVLSVTYLSASPTPPSRSPVFQNHPRLVLAIQNRAVRHGIWTGPHMLKHGGDPRARAGVRSGWSRRQLAYLPSSLAASKHAGASECQRSGI